MDINKSLDFYMNKHNLNQESLMRRSGLNASTISLIRNGHRLPSLTTVQILAHTFNVRTSTFIARGETTDDTQLLQRDSRFSQVL